MKKLIRFICIVTSFALLICVCACTKQPESSSGSSSSIPVQSSSSEEDTPGVVPETVKISFPQRAEGYVYDCDRESDYDKTGVLKYGVYDEDDEYVYYITYTRKGYNTNLIRMDKKTGIESIIDTNLGFFSQLTDEIIYYHKPYSDDDPEDYKCYIEYEYNTKSGTITKNTTMLYPDEVVVDAHEKNNLTDFTKLKYPGGFICSYSIYISGLEEPCIYRFFLMDKNGKIIKTLPIAFRTNHNYNRYIYYNNMIVYLDNSYTLNSYDIASGETSELLDLNTTDASKITSLSYVGNDTIILYCYYENSQFILYNLKNKKIVLTFDLHSDFCDYSFFPTYDDEAIYFMAATPQYDKNGRAINEPYNALYRIKYDDYKLEKLCDTDFLGDIVANNEYLYVISQGEGSVLSQLIRLDRDGKNKTTVYLSLK